LISDLFVLREAIFEEKGESSPHLASQLKLTADAA
jgi:hypothetical protein